MTPNDRGRREWLPAARDSPGLEDQVESVLDALIPRLVDPDRLQTLGQNAVRRWNALMPAYPRERGGLQLSWGPLSGALLAAQLAKSTASTEWQALGHQLLSSSSEGLDDSEPIGLHSGLGALAFAAMRLRRPGSNDYQGLLRSTLVYMEEDVAAASQRNTGGQGFAAYDLISGLAGVTLLALEADAVGYGASLVSAASDRLVLTCNAMSTDRDGSLLFLAPHNLATASERKVYPLGYVNLGLAHGIPGPLLALAIAAGSVANEDVQNTAERLARQLLTSARGVGAGMRWPNAVSTNNPHGPDDRSSWCYGTPGAARALFLAGRALGRPCISSLAEDAALGLAVRVLRGERHLDSSLCHGVAGVMQVLGRFFNDTGREEFRDATVNLAAELLARFASQEETGFTDYIDGSKFSSPGFLDGSIGIALALKALIDDEEPTWDAALGLSGLPASDQGHPLATKRANLE